VAEIVSQTSCILDSTCSKLVGALSIGAIRIFMENLDNFNGKI